MTTEILAQFRGKALLLCRDEECESALRSWLSDAGLTVEIVDTGVTAAARIEEGDVAALFIDRFPPPWVELDSISTMKRRCAGLKIIVVGNSETEHFRLAAAVGIDAALPRPLTRAMVLEALGLGEEKNGWCTNGHGNDIWLRKERRHEMVGTRA